MSVSIISREKGSELTGATGELIEREARIETATDQRSIDQIRPGFIGSDALTAIALL